MRTNPLRCVDLKPPRDDERDEAKSPGESLWGTFEVVRGACLLA